MRRRTLSSHAFVSLALMFGAGLASTPPAFAQQITLISAANDGTQASGGNSKEPSISGDGRFIAFVSDATNLVPNDTNNVADIFVKDRVTSAIERVSVRSTGDQSTAASASPRISANGRFVIFESFGPLVAEDTNTCGNPSAPCQDVYVHDRQTHATTRVSVSSTGTQGTHISFTLGVSADGRFVLFSSESPNLVDNDTNNSADVFLRDMQNSTTTRVSLGVGGTQLPTHTAYGAMSADGRVILYTAVLATDQRSELYLYARETGQVSILSSAFPERILPSEFPPGSYDPSYFFASHVSDDGRIVAVTEFASHVQSKPMLSPIQRYLLHDRLTGHTTATAWHDFTGLYDGMFLGLSGDGRTYAATAQLHNVVELVDRVSGLRETIPTANANSSKPLTLSSDGRFTAFTPNPEDTNVLQQVYVYDRDSGDSDGMPSAWETAFGLNPNNLTDAAADADLDGVTNLQEYLRGTHPAAVASLTRYFAEGAANSFFTTRFAAVNPGDTAAAVVFRFLGSGGETSSVMRTIAPRSRITLELPENGLAPGNDFSTVIETNQLVVADRTMTWDRTGYGAHAETAITAPSTTWYLAEGATHGAFDLFYLLQNANDFDAHVSITYLRQAPLGPVTKTYTVERNSRKTIPVDAEGPDLEAVDTAASITSDLPIVVERAMYSTRPGQPAFAAGHGAAGVTAPATRWFLAEGATGTFFDLYVLVGNPNTTRSDLKVTYLLPSGYGAPIEKLYSVGPQQRLTIYVQDEDPRLGNVPVSTIVESTNNQPVVVERAMWWPKDQWYESHVSAGATTTGTKWALADGEVGVWSETYILIANTSTTAGTATVTLLEEGGTPVQFTFDLEASSRFSFPVSLYLPRPVAGPPRRFGALIETNGVQAVVERAMYSNAGGLTWGAGTAALGTKLQ